MIKVYLDYETRSESNLKNVGAYKYSLHPTTEVICACYKVQGEGVKTWYALDDEPLPDDLRRYLSRPDIYEIVAHNSFFEYCITRNVLGFKRGPETYNCTASRGSACALHRNLEGLAFDLRLPVKKDMEGNRLVKKYCKPRPVWTKWVKEGRQGPEPKKYFDDEFELMSILSYCEVDVLVLELVDQKLPDLIPVEKTIWDINQTMNSVGITIDIDTVKKVLDFYNEEALELQKRVRTLTGGRLYSINQRDALLDFLKTKNVFLPNLTAETIKRVLEDKKDLNPIAVELLEIRQKLSMTSIKKYKAMVDRLCDDGRVKDLALYHKATTGREGGTGIQVHNLPRGSVKDTNAAIDFINSCDTYNDLDLLYDNRADLYSSCIRGMLTASPGFSLAVADLNAIECRVLNWLADNKSVINDFEKDRDPYLKMASRIFNREITKEDAAERFLGKTAELGCGYGMGEKKFYETCISWGVPNVTPELAKRAVKVYRDTHQAVVNLWYKYENAAITAISTGRAVQVGHVVWGFKNNFLFCHLPSGRKIFFPYPKLRNEPTPWGEKRPKIYYYRMKLNKWDYYATYGGSLVESVCQAVARDVNFNGVINLVSEGYRYLFQVHDEVITEKNGTVNIDEFTDILTTKANWFKTLPIKAEGWTGPRYRKD